LLLGGPASRCGERGVADPRVSSTRTAGFSSEAPKAMSLPA
jgi:hypothetical protein